MSKPTPDSNTRELQISTVDKILANHAHGECDLDCGSFDDDLDAISLLLQEAEDRGYRRGAIEELEYMLQCDRDNKEAGHKWSSGDWRKFVEAELMELKEVED